MLRRTASPKGMSRLEGMTDANSDRAKPGRRPSPQGHRRRILGSLLLVQVPQIGRLTAKLVDVAEIAGSPRLAIDRAGQILILLGQGQLHAGQILAILLESHGF